MHMQSVFNLIVDILMNIHVILRAQGYNPIKGLFLVGTSYMIPIVYRDIDSFSELRLF